ncbi:MAG: hypothetical protein AAFO03_04975 [Bacteroidota bacterium]
MNFSFAKYLALSFCLILISAVQAQPEWHLGIYGQYETPLPDVRDYRVSGISPGAFIGFRVKYPKVHMNVNLNLRYEKLRLDSVELLWSNFGSRENLWQDNLMLGPGLEAIIFPENKVQLLLGMGIYVGIPLRTQYEYFGPDTSPVSTASLPVYAAIDGGVGNVISWQSHLGIRGALNKQLDWQLQLGYGYSDQAFDWTEFDTISSFGLLHSGGFFFTSLGTVYTL